MPELFASADIALVPLKGQIPGAVPSKLYEAMASGLPVVLVASGEPADIVRSARAGIVVEPGDPEGLAGALRHLAQSPEDRRQLGDAGRETAVAGSTASVSATTSSFASRNDQGLSIRTVR